MNQVLKKKYLKERERGNSTINSKYQNSKRKGIRERERERANPRGKRFELGPNRLVESNLRAEGVEVDTCYGRETRREQVLGISM